MKASRSGRSDRKSSLAWAVAAIIGLMAWAPMPAGAAGHAEGRVAEKFEIFQNWAITDMERNRKGQVLGAVAQGSEFRVVRFGRNGKLDGSFGHGGIATPLAKVRDPFIRGGLDQGESKGLDVGPDGRIAVVGVKAGGAAMAASRAYIVAVLHPDGTRDRRFAKDGFVHSRLPYRAGGMDLHDVSFRDDGGLIAVGSRNEEVFHGHEAIVMAFERDGSLDRSFGHGGKASIITGDAEGKTAFDNVEVLPSGKILATGYLAGRWVVTRFDPDGSIDRSFGTRGKAILWRGKVDCAAGCNDFSRFVVRRGRIFVTSVPGRDTGNLVAKLTAGGRRVKAFGRNGIATIPQKAALPAVSAVRGRYPAYSTGGIGVTKDMRPVIAGSTTVNVRNGKGPAKDLATAIPLDRKGKLERSFGIGGFSIGSKDDGYYSAIVSTGGHRFFLAGGLSEPEGKDFRSFLTLTRLRR